MVNIVPLRPVGGIDIDVACCRCCRLVVYVVKNTVTGCEHRQEPTAYNSLCLANNVRHLLFNKVFLAVSDNQSLVAFDYALAVQVVIHIDGTLFHRDALNSCWCRLREC